MTWDGEAGNYQNEITIKLFLANIMLITTANSDILHIAVENI